MAVLTRQTKRALLLGAVSVLSVSCFSTPNDVCSPGCATGETCDAKTLKCVATTSTGGNACTNGDCASQGGTPSNGGTVSTGGSVLQGGAVSNGGSVITSGGSIAQGGNVTGGATSVGGSASNGGGVAQGGAMGMGGATACGTDTWANYGSAFFATTCNPCHAAVGKPGFASQAAVKAAAANVTVLIQLGRMPQGVTLSAADKTRILNYLGCGAP